MSNNFISKGSVWGKWDLQIQPIKDEWFCNIQNKKTEIKNATKEYLSEAIKKQLSVIAITDHNCGVAIDSAFELIKEEKYNIVVLPGVEINVNTGYQILIIFNPSYKEKIKKQTWEDSINHFLNHVCHLASPVFNVHGQAESINGDIHEIIDKIHKEDIGLVIFAHSQSNEGLFKKTTGADRKKFFENSFADKYRFILDHKTNEETKETIKIINSWNFDQNDFALIKTSDAHKASDVGTKFTWIKSESTFQGLKEILYEPILRVSLDNQCPVYLHPQLTFIEIETPKEYLNQQIVIKDRFCLAEVDKILFNPNLNSLIGGRATGKSTLLELLGFVFDKYQTSENPKKPSIIENLQSKYSKIKIKIGFKFGEKEYETEKGLSDVKSNLFGFDIIYLPQDEIEKRASDDEAITDLINNLIDESKLKADKSTLINNRLTLEKYRNNYFQIFAKEKELKVAQDELQKTQLVLNFTQSEQYKSLVAELSLKIKERERVNNAISGIDWQVEVLTRTKQELEENLNSDIASLSDYMMDSESHAVEKTEQKIVSIIKSLEKASSDVKKSEKYKKLLSDINDLQKKYIQACKQLGLDSINQNKIKDALENKGKVEIKIRQLEQEIKLIKSAKSKHNTELKLFEKAYENHQNLEKTLIDDAKTKFGTDLEITVEENNEKLEKKIIDLFVYYQKLAGKYNLKEPDIKSIISGLTLKEIISHLEQNKIPTGCEDEKKNNNEHKLTAQFFFIDENFLYRETLIMNLKEVFPENNFVITFKNKKLHEMSFGERCGVVLRLILSNSNLPLIIDQPEDHLDNKYIVKELLDLIKSKKQERQIILSTHNPNIVVNGDSELTIGLELDSKTSYSYVLSGALENNAVKDLITGILEGGEEAFIKRERKYDFKI